MVMEDLDGPQAQIGRLDQHPPPLHLVKTTHSHRRHCQELGYLKSNEWGGST
jgi:hypothetical protein